VDEVQTGFGRPGNGFWMYETHGELFVYEPSVHMCARVTVVTSPVLHQAYEDCSTIN